jgi:hypothetical protein
MVSLNQCFIESSDRQELLQIANRKEELHISTKGICSAVRTGSPLLYFRLIPPLEPWMIYAAIFWRDLGSNVSGPAGAYYSFYPLDDWACYHIGNIE